MVSIKALTANCLSWKIMLLLVYCDCEFYNSFGRLPSEKNILKKIKLKTTFTILFLKNMLLHKNYFTNS